jgi:hypothetical protein
MNKIRKELEGFSKERCDRARARQQHDIYDPLNELTVELINLKHNNPRKSQRKRMEKLARKAHEG